MEGTVSEDAIKQAEAAKAAGNQAFAAFKYSEAIDEYTKAIELTAAKPNHIYYSNRANAYLFESKYDECIADCNKSLEIEPTFVKTYYRKAKALMCLMQMGNAAKVLQEGL